MSMYEKWLPVVGYEGLYEVSWSGRVRNARTGRVLSPTRNTTGYLKVALHAAGRRRDSLVHRLVLEAFEGPCPEGMEACHENGDPHDNVWDNLRWDSRSSNMRDRVRHGTHNMASKTHCPQGHEYTPDNVYLNGGGRFCRTCRAYRARNRNKERSVA